jgi:predicted ATPase
LARILGSADTPELSQEIKRLLRQFGRDSGLFRDIRIARLGKGRSGPIQVLVTDSGGVTSSLADVGYGVSQVLPVLVQAALSSSFNLLLIQQPEVHLHPKAQAALGTFMAGLVKSKDCGIVVETHSDYIIDRVRKAVAEGVLDSKQVGLLFFDKMKSKTTVSLIELDDAGNLIDPPMHYRRFFLEEELAVISRGG